jgi:hypothetical protein
MKIKESLLLTALAPLVCLPVSMQAAPLVSIGDNVDVFFNGSSSLRWSSNLFRDEDTEVDDLLLTLSPGFEMNVGRGVSNVDLSVITRYDFLRYQDNSDLDTETGHIKAIGSYKSSRLDLSGSASFDQQQSSTGDGSVNLKGELIESEVTRANLDGEYRVSPKFSFGAGVRYREQAYVSFEDRFADRESITFPADIFYELTPKVDLSIGYQYRMEEVEGTVLVTDSGPPVIVRSVGSYDSVSHFFNVGARGNLLPKLTGFFKVGYRTRNSDDSVIRIFEDGILDSTDSTNRNSTGMLGADANFTWLATPKLTTRLALSRDFGVGGDGASTENSSANLSASYSINSNYAATANLGYTLRDYDSDRKDHQYSAGLRLSYVPNQYWRFSTGYTYSENDTNQFDRSYINHILDLSASLRY